MVFYESINHKNTSIEDREVYFHTLQKEYDTDSYVVLQTCNRIEVYFGDGDIPDEVAHHLFRVVSGLESALIGERAIQGQVREAYLQAKNSRKLSASLHKLFETALLVGKKVREETDISRGAIGHGNATIEILTSEGVALKDAKITIIGVNKLTSDILKFLQNKGAKQVFLANRSIEKARKLAEPLNIEIHSLEERKSLLSETDVLISATSAPHHIVTIEDVNPQHPFLAIDLAFPRDIDPRIAELKGFKLFNIQDIEYRVNKNLNIRNSEIHKVESIIRQETTNLQMVLERRKLYSTAL